MDAKLFIGTHWMRNEGILKKWFGLCEIELFLWQPIANSIRGVCLQNYSNQDTNYPVLVQPKKTPPDMTEKLNRIKQTSTKEISVYEGCSNMNASSFITFFTYMLRQNVIPFWKELFVAFKVAPNIKKNSLYFSSYILLYKGHSCILAGFLKQIAMHILVHVRI